MNTSIAFITVVRDFDMYTNFFENNEFTRNFKLVPIDNRKENLAVSKQYNQFLNEFDFTKAAWLVFCHEDWKLNENILKKLEKLDKNYLYGPIGTRLESKNKTIKRYIGQIINSDKNGYNRKKHGCFAYSLDEMDTFDCQCLIVHSSLIQKHCLRFDTNLSFDLYVEDFCINAKENFNIASRVLQIRCQHYSWGAIKPPFEKQFLYLQSKYQNASHSYSICVGDNIIGYKQDTIKIEEAVCLSWLNKIQRFVYETKVNKKGIKKIKLLKIPIWSRKL